MIRHILLKWRLLVEARNEPDQVRKEPFRGPSSVGCLGTTENSVAVSHPFCKNSAL